MSPHPKAKVPFTQAERDDIMRWANGVGRPHAPIGKDLERQALMYNRYEATIAAIPPVREVASRVTVAGKPLTYGDLESAYLSVRHYLAIMLKNRECYEGAGPNCGECDYCKALGLLGGDEVAASIRSSEPGTYNPLETATDECYGDGFSTKALDEQKERIKRTGLA